MKTIIMFSAIVGSSIGSYAPALWGAGFLSFSSVFFGSVGGFLGIWTGYKLGQRLGL